jgi:GDP-4-dehydro-6-deoxy-D-mannose reductase
MSNRALVTGAAGFVGGYLKAHLEASGWTVVTSDYGQGDIPCDFAEADDIVRLVEAAGEVSHVFHLAARTFVPDAMRDPCPTFDVNLEGTIHLEQAIRTHRPEARLIFISSGEVYGPPRQLPVDEDHPLNPGNPYAISKTAADQYCAFAAKAWKSDLIRVRPFNHSGAGQADNFVLSSFARQVAEAEAGKAEPVLKVGNLAAARDFSHVKDVVRAYEAIAREGEGGTAYNVCSGTATVIQEALDFLVDQSAVKVSVETDPDRMRPVDVPEVRGSHQRLTDQTGWQPDLGLEDVLMDLLYYWRGVARG